MQKRDCFPAVPSRFSDSRSSGRRLAIDTQAVVRHWHLHPGGAVVHGHHHRGHCGQHHGNDEPLYKIRQFFHLLHPQLVFGRQRVRARASSSAASGPESCFTHAGRSAAPGPVLSASAKLARPVSVRSFHAIKPSGAMWAPRRQSSTAVLPSGRHGRPR